MRILHTESSKGWGGQEIRILNEAKGMRDRGHKIIFAVNRGGQLIEKARKEGFTVHELSFTKQASLQTIFQLVRLIKKHAIDLVNTHSSLDAWIGGIAARIVGTSIIRTRHLSTPIRSGLNSYLLYKALADFIVTTSSSIIPMIAKQAKLPLSRLLCIPTGIIPSQLHVDAQAVKQFRDSLRLGPNDVLVGTVCFVRSWKGIDDLLKAAQLLQDRKEIKWVVVGGGHVNDFRHKLKELKLEETVIFTGHLDVPYPAIAAMDIFLLLSTAHEGISQASLQAAYLSRPLITTNIGGLPEVCIDGKTGRIVPPFSPQEVAKAVSSLLDSPSERHAMGLKAKDLVATTYTLQQTLDKMELVYQLFLEKK